MRYEAVHEISSWADLRNRLDSDRRCYAFFHPRMPREPLIFVEVAFVPEMAADVHSLLDEKAPLEDLRRVRWAIFYSISNTQPGLRGVSFGNFLLKRVIDELQVDFPKLRNFATLSPIPGFNDWLKSLSTLALVQVLGPKRAKLLGQEGRRRPMSPARRWWRGCRPLPSARARKHRSAVLAKRWPRTIWRAKPCGDSRVIRLRGSIWATARAWSASTGMPIFRRRARSSRAA